MEDRTIHPKPTKEAHESQPDDSAAGETVKVVDRKGNVKVIPHSEYERKKRRRRKRNPRKHFPFRDLLSVALVMLIMALAIYIALKIIQ